MEWPPNSNPGLLIGLEITSTLKGDSLWQGDYSTDRSDGELPFSPFSLGSAAIRAGRVNNDKDMLPATDKQEQSEGRIMALGWFSTEGFQQNTEMLQGYIKPLKDALEADRKENELLRKQVSTDRDMIDASNEKLKFFKILWNLLPLLKNLLERWNLQQKIKSPAPTAKPV